MPPSRVSAAAGFTLLELLVVMAVVGLLAGLTATGVGAALERGRRARCGSQLRQLVMANQMYADEHRTYVPAAADLIGPNLQRWHGLRKNAREPFDGTLGPLVPYLGTAARALRACPSMQRYATDAAANAFEASSGGYGYNAVGVGSQTYLMGMRSQANRAGMRPSQIRDPARTVMFADAAFPQPYGRSPTHLIEYSFVEPYHWVFQPGRESSFRADPSIHFRHGGRANVAWCDGSVTSERLTTRAEDHFSRFNIGWFGPPDNSLFDPY